MSKQIAAARAVVMQHKFGTPEWEAAMQIVRDLCAAEMAARAPEPFTSVDSGWHPTRLLDGRVINA